jgi:chemotaxis protein methyltransferase CheR
MNMTPQDFDFVSRYAKAEAALVFEPGKEYLVESRLEPIVRQYGLSSIAELIGQLRSGPSLALKGHVIDALTTHETSFFRDFHPFEALRSTIFPELIERNKTTRTITIWCAAASSGQEPYSIALVFFEHFPLLRDWRLQLICTDISKEVLDKAATGIYSQFEVNRGLPAPLLVKHFIREGDKWRIKDYVRSMTSFKTMNLAVPWKELPPCDIVFMRNVLIYFDLDTRRGILERTLRTLKKDGILFLGTAESPTSLVPSFTRRELARCSCFVASER